MLNLNADLLYNNCVTHHFSEFQWTPALSGKLILGFQKHRKPECSILKICLGEHAARSPYLVARAFGTRKAPCAAKKSRVRCFQNYVRYFKNLSKTLQYDFFLLVVRGVILSVTLRRAHEACDMASQANAKTKPSTRRVRYFPFLFENAFFFLRFRLPSTCIRWKRSPSHVSFQKRSPDWRFLKTLAARLRVDGRKRRFSNTMT